MFSLCMAIALTTALTADRSPEELIAYLASPDRVIREEAARTLEERGPDVSKALQDARKAAGTPEGRERLDALISRVEARSIDRATPITLDFEDRLLGEAVAAVAARARFPLELDDPALADRMVSVKSSGPIPFWEAVDRLGRAGHVRHDPGRRTGPKGEEIRASTIRLVAGDPPALTAYSGPLRIHLFASHRHRDRNFAIVNPHLPATKAAPVTVEVQAFAEPGRFINPNGLPRLEAVDEQGRPIAPPPAGGVELPNPAEHSWLTPGRLSLLHWHVPIGLPDPPVKPPLKLRGVLPVVISSRRPDPMVIPLADADGKTIRQGSGFVRIEKGSNKNVWSHPIVLVFGDANPPDRARVSTGPETDYLGDYIPNRVQFEDAEGSPLAFQVLPNFSTSGSAGEVRVQILVSGNTAPDRLVVYRLNRLATEIPFEIADVPAF